MSSVTASVAGLARSFAAAVLALLLSVSPLLARDDAGPATAKQDIPEVTVAELPREARETLRLIRQGGPFSYERDGAVFGNHEKLLPRRERGYYREYTVRTSGVKSRGARRIVVGCAVDGGAMKSPVAGSAREPKLFCGAAGEFYYSGDHYQSFRRIRE